MGQRAVKLVALAVLLVCIGSHISELLDTWDHTLNTGNDIESALVVLTLAVGAALALSSVAAVLANVAQKFDQIHVANALLQAVCHLIIFTHSPPVIPLRI